MISAIIQSPSLDVLFEFNKDILRSMLLQIIKSREFLALSNKLSAKDRKKYLKNIDMVVEQVSNKLKQYYKREYNVTSSKDYVKLLNQLTTEQIIDIRKKVCKEVLESIGS